MSLPSRNAGFSPWSLLFLAMGVTLLGAFALQDLPLLFTGVRTTGTVEAVEGEGRRHRYLRVAFRMEDGSRVKVRIHESMTSDHSVGDTVQIAYLRSDPGTVEILTVSQMGTSVLMKILFGATAVAMGIFGLMPDRGGKPAGAEKKGASP